jgi:hypothetical protein
MYWTMCTDSTEYVCLAYPTRVYVDPSEEIERYWRRVFRRLGSYLQARPINAARVAEYEKKHRNKIHWTTKMVSKIWRTIKAFWRWKTRN